MATSTTYHFTGTVTSAEKQQASATQPFIVTSGSGGNTALMGATITAPTNATNLETYITNWTNLVYPCGFMKIYYQKANNPPPTSVSAADNHTQAAAALGIPVLLCYEPTIRGTTADVGQTTLSGSAVGSGGTFTAGTYFWKVTVLTAAGEGTPSNEKSLTIATNGEASLTWTTLPPGATGVNVYRGTSTGNENTLVATLGPVTSYTDTGIAGTAKTPPANWPGGADKPALGTYASNQTGTVLGDLHDMIASVNGLTATSQTNPLNVVGVVLWQEADNGHNYIPNGGTSIASTDQYTYLYYQNYAAFKANVSGIPFGCVITGYNNPYATSSLATTWIPGPTSLRPNDNQYTDFIMVDIYGTGYHNLKYTPYQNGPGNAPNTGDAGHLWDICDWMTQNANPCAAGWSEAGNSADGTATPQQYVVPYISSSSYTDPSSGTVYPGDPNNSIQAHFKYRLTNSLPTMPFGWYVAENAAGTGSTGPNGIFQAGDYRITLLDSLYKTITGKTA